MARSVKQHKRKTDVWHLLRQMYNQMIPVEDIMLRVDNEYPGSGNFFIGVFSVDMWGREGDEHPVIVGRGYWIDYATNLSTYSNKSPYAICYDVYGFFESTDQFQILDFTDSAIKYSNRLPVNKPLVQYRLF